MDGRATPAARLHISAECPHCQFALNHVAVLTTADVPSISPMSASGAGGDFFDNGFNQGEGGYVTGCESCGQAFTIPRPLVQDAQHACLVLIGEA